MTNPTQDSADELDTALDDLLKKYFWSAKKEHAWSGNIELRQKEVKAKLKQLIGERERLARIDQMNYVDQRLIGKNTSGDRVFYDKEAVIAENKLKDHQRVISDAMKAELQSPKLNQAGVITAGGK